MINNSRTCALVLTGCMATVLAAQPKKAFQAQSASTVAVSTKDGQQAIEITNVAYEVTNSQIPGRPREERLLLRKTTHTKELVGDIGMEASTTIQSWPFGVDPSQKPLYSLTVAGIDPKTLNSEVLVISRGLEEVEWWSVYGLGNGVHMFDTYVPVVVFPVGGDMQQQRYAGLEVPPDDTADSRLKSPNVVAVLTYSSGSRVIREALITCDNRQTALQLRSFADTERKLTAAKKRSSVAAGKNSAGASGDILTIAWGPADPSMPPSHAITIPIAKDDLDLANAQLPSGIHVTAWKR